MVDIPDDIKVARARASLFEAAVHKRFPAYVDVCTINDAFDALRSERDAAKAMCDEMAKALEEISDACPSGSRWTTMSDGTWRSACRDLQGIARLAVAPYRKAQEVGND